MKKTRKTSSRRSNMKGGLGRLLRVRFLPRWMVYGLELLILSVSLGISYFILNVLKVSPQSSIPMYEKFLLIIGVNSIFLLLFKTYSGIIRYSTFVDLAKIFFASVSTFVTLVCINLFSMEVYGDKLILFPVLILYFIFSFAFLFCFRLGVKEFYHFVREFSNNISKKNILMLGVDEHSVAMANAVQDTPSVNYQIAGFLVEKDSPNVATLLGKKIYSKDCLTKDKINQLNIEGVLIIQDNLTREEINSWVNYFLDLDIEVFKSSSVQKYKDEKEMASSIKSIQIEDLLNRKPIKLDNEEVKRRHHGKAVLVTGGAGSIGSEIVRQVAQYNPSLIVVLDQAETPLYEVELELRATYPHVEFRFILCDISNKRRLERIFNKFQFSMVYHAAAYKHVPLIEENPHEGVLVNIYGTKNVASLSSQYGINRFVMVSTDKAVNPTNVMGATKRSAELYVQALQDVEGNTTKFITTRFGNVLGSNGSVIPHFKKQIAAGGPVTVTHPEIVRYFMTISEACELVLQAGTMGSGGEIFVFDMGKPVKILDLANRMIKLSGLEPEKDIKIEFTGLRPGEKLYEELLSDDTKNLPTPNPKIMVSKDPHMQFNDIDTLAIAITKAALKKDKLEVVKQLKNIVPEFKSNNSIFEVLDKAENRL